MSKHNHDESHHFIVPLKYYVGTFVSLLFLTVITVAAAQFDFGAANIFVALLIASIKAGLVVGFFMGLHWEKGFNRILFFGSFLFLAIFIVFTWSDPATRGDIDPVEKGVHGIKSNVKLISNYDNAHHGESSH